MRQYFTDNAGAACLATENFQVHSSLIRRGLALFPRRDAVRETVRALLMHSDYDPVQ